ncbi:MAG TPA: hypothetical protein DHV84_06165 [Desulfotomaculum sp.]|nr:hypothetical protein [Desulfotomaculum sp.]
MIIEKLLFDVLVGVPLSLGVQILENIRDEVDKERLITEEAVKERLQQIQILLQDNEVSEKEYEELETALIERLKVIKEYQRGG